MPGIILETYSETQEQYGHKALKTLYFLEVVYKDNQWEFPPEMSVYMQFFF